MHGYVYHIKDNFGNYGGWLPFDTAVAKAQFAYSVLTKNVTLQQPSYLPEFENIYGVKLYPNPTDDMQVISIDAENHLSLEISMFNSYGALVKHCVTGYTTPGNSQVVMDVSTLQSGMYLYRVTIGGKSQYIKTFKL